MEQRPAIFKLNLDCFDHVFDYLALEDLGRFSRTCKAMKWAVGEYYQANYGTIAENAELAEENLYLFDHTIGYSDFVQKLCIYPLEEDDENYMSVKRDLSKKVIELEIDKKTKTHEWTESQLRRIEYIINNAEVLNIIRPMGIRTMSESIYETVPGMCKSLKRLHMYNFQYNGQIYDGNKWLLHEYPTLEHLMWTQSEEHGYKINEIKAFFELNPNVRSFATDADCLRESRQLIIESGVKLDDLTIEVHLHMSENISYVIKNICNLLNELHEKGVYKRLHLKLMGFKKIIHQIIQQIIDKIKPINVVRSVCLPRHSKVNLSNLVNLVELQLYGCIVTKNVDVMASSNLVNLERIELNCAFLVEMLSFIYHSVKLKKLKVNRFLDRNISALDLATMNKRREQLLDATKVTIFINEKVYLATKWASTLTDYRLIEMKRSTAHEWGHHFRPYRYSLRLPF